jgi:hypothetical protein
MSGAGDESMTGSLPAGEGMLLLVAIVGVIAVTGMSGFGADGLGTLLLGIAISVVPYVLTYVVGKLISLARVKRALAGGLAIYLALDVWTRYEVFFVSTSSTAAIAVMLVLIFSVLIIPAGAALTYLLLRLLGRGDGAALK